MNDLANTTIESLASLFELFPDAALAINSAGIIVLANTHAGKMFGYVNGELVGQSIGILIPEAKRSAHTKLVAEYSDEPKRRSMGKEGALFGRRIDGSNIPVDIMLGPVEIGGEKYSISIVRDMTSTQKLQDKLEALLAREQKMARTDLLTGAANLRQFYELLESEIGRIGQYKNPFSVAYIDLDGFKQINDQHGHLEGDAVLRRVVKCINQHSRDYDAVARIGGDEFAILFPETNDETALLVMERIQEFLLEEMRTRDWRVTFSIGLLTCLDAPDTPREIIKVVDDNMYYAKRNGKNMIKHSIYSIESYR